MNCPTYTALAQAAYMPAHPPADAAFRAEAHRATCPVCQAHERANREQWERLRGMRVTARRDDTREYREETR